MKRTLFLSLVSLAACSVIPNLPGTAPPPAQPMITGVLVMAHGGGPDWNNAITAAVAPISQVAPTALAYGMADPYTLSAGLDSLREAGVDRVAVVRMFLSGESFREQTEYLLGLSPVPPKRFVLMHAAPSDQSAPEAIDHRMVIATHRLGIIDSDQTSSIIRQRAREESERASEESVLLIAHGMGSEKHNQQVLAAMRAIAHEVAQDGFAAVEVATLREDWAEKRVNAERRIREFVEGEGRDGRRVIVLPMRLFGFGPYSDVLAGLEFSPGEGLLPGAPIADWILHTAAQISCDSGWGDSLGSCGSL